MSQLEMGAGNSKLKLGIAGGLVVVFGIAAYSFMGSSSEESASKPAKPVASAQEQAAPAPAAPDMTAAAAPVETQPAPAAPAGEASGASAAVEPAPTPAAAQHPVELAMADTNSTPAAATSSDASPMSMDDLTAEESGAAEEAPAAPVRKARSVAHNKPVAPPRPPASAVLREWWKSDSREPFAVDFVGQAAGSTALVILFAKPVDPAAAGRHVQVLGADGKPVELSWQRGNSPRVLVHNELKPGRYTVVLDGGSKLSGPVFIQ